MDNKQINIGLFGFGTVGKGLYDVLKKIQPENVSIVKVCVRNVAKHSAEAPELEFTSNADDIFSDTRINFIVELIDDAEAAYGIVKRALQAKIPVVSGNKKMLARHIQEMIQLQRDNDTALLYDASACGSIPVIRNLEEYYDNDLLISVKGCLLYTSGTAPLSFLPPICVASAKNTEWQQWWSKLALRPRSLLRAK